MAALAISLLLDTTTTTSSALWQSRRNEQRRAAVMQLDHHGRRQVDWRTVHFASLRPRKIKHKKIKQKTIKFQPDASDDQDEMLPDDLLLEKIERLLAREPRVPIISQLQPDPIHEAEHSEMSLTMEWNTGTSLDDDTCHLLEGEGEKMFFLCASPPDNQNLACTQAADGMDWVCVERRGDEDDADEDWWPGEMQA